MNLRGKMPRAYCRVRVAGIVALVLSTTAMSCGSDQDGFCRSAQELQAALSDLELDDFTTALGADFWSAAQSTLDDIVRSTSGELRQGATAVQQELNALVERLEAVNYNWALIALSPSVAADLATVATALIAFAANELQTEIDINCNL